ncbi:hypothetical protein [Pseudoalteromonas rubra]|uniref:hypothetical protein n=1 Tax=Pseudoalteromonas rubra TaxID=43658 RepID=UPI000F77175F|nr:hypothetical protein [Pseudoalteromonas rubra]
MDINLVITILLTLFIVGFSLHKSIAAKSSEERNQRAYEILEKLENDLDRCTKPAETQAVLTTFVFETSAFIKEAGQEKREGTSTIKTGTISSKNI